MNAGLAPCEKLARQHGIPPELLEASWEVGRLVLSPRYRSSPESLKRFLFLTLVDLLSHTWVEHLFASCTPVLSRLYRRFGFSVMVKDASHDAEGSYCLIHGHVPAVLRALVTCEAERRLAEGALGQHAGKGLLPC